MLASATSTCDLADLVSGKVRELDLAQSRVQATLARIDAIEDRSNCIEGARQALQTEDYEAAAKYVETFMHLDEEYGLSGGRQGGGWVEQTLETAAAGDQRKQLLESKQKLETVIRKKFSAAVEARDHPNVVRFVKLYPSLGLHEEALKSYVGYLRKVVALRARDEFEGLKDSLEQAAAGRGGVQQRANFVGVLNHLFKDIALAIEDNEDLLKSVDEDDGVVYAIKELQEECDAKGSLILKKYMEYRKLAKLAKDISMQNKNLLAVASAEGPDPREIEIFLEEMLLLGQTSEDYTHFMITKMREAAAQVSPRNLFKGGSFYRSVQELIGHYIILEEFFMVENVKKAIKIDEVVPDALTTSMVDDVFFVLQSCCRRAVCTMNVQSVLAVLNCGINLLNNEFKEALLRKIREPNLASRLFLGGAGVPKTGSEISTALNNADISAEYAIKLRHEIEEQCNEAFPAPADREKLKSCLTELGETNAALRQILNVGLEQLANSITPRLRSMLDIVSTVNYELTETQYAENEVSDPWVQKMLHAVEINVTWLQPFLTTNNYDSLVHLIIDFIVKRIEVIMTQKRFNQLGGLQLDRDTRTLVGHFSGMTQRTVRDKFARLIQMATILNLEKVIEILDFWGENSGPVTWRLTPAEVRRILSLRVDFRPEAIAALKL
ncbi:hypothetical protein O6H91_Y371800 [Diphasiastrum complanatum]|nr:hypothetical protein O6H91_Y371800 [Diphasiastrum complanatum]